MTVTLAGRRGSFEMTILSAPYFKRLLFCLVSGLLFLEGSCQLDESNFVLYSRSEGLSNNNITGILQDKLGYLWISTRIGLNRYNGSEFFQFHSDSTDNSLPVEDIGKLQWLGEDQLAAITMGLHIVNTNTSQSANIIIPPGELKYAFKVNAIMSAQANKQAAIFILTRSGFYHFNEKRQLVFRFDYYKKEEADTSSFFFGNSLVMLNDNTVLVKAVDGLRIYDVDTRQLKRINRDEFPLFAQIVDFPAL